MGNRAVREIDGQKVVFFNVGSFQLEAYDLAAGNATSVIYEPGINRPLAQMDSAGNLIFFHQDVQGSVVLLTDAAGAKLESYTYDAWGNPTGKSAAGTAVPASGFKSHLLYAGAEFDPETGLYHLRARAYSSELGRFLQNDPIDFAGGDSNMLRYCLNSPLDLVDPFGLWGIEDCFNDVFPNLWGDDAPSSPSPNDQNNPPPGQDPNKHPDGRNKTRIWDTNNSRGGGFGGGGGLTFVFSGAGAGGVSGGPLINGENFLHGMEVASNLAAGFGDAISFGITNAIRETYSGNDILSKDSFSYGSGQVSGFMFATFRGGVGAVNGVKFVNRTLDKMTLRHALPRGPSIP